jgi:hypothetical protein
MYHGIVERLCCSSPQPQPMDQCRRRKLDVASFSLYFCPLSDFRHLLVTYFNSVLDESWSNILHCVWIAVSTITITFKERHGHEEKHVNTREGGIFPNRELSVSGSWADRERTVSGPWADRERTHDGNTALHFIFCVLRILFPKFITEEGCGLKVLNPENGGNMFLRNVDANLHHYTVPKPRRPQSALLQVDSWRSDAHAYFTAEISSSDFSW